MSSKNLNNEILNSYCNNAQNRKIPIYGKIKIKIGEPILLNIVEYLDDKLKDKIKIETSSKVIPEEAKNQPLDSNRVIELLNKTNDTPFYFENIKVEMDDNVFIPGVKYINELRREAINELIEKNKERTYRKLDNVELNDDDFRKILKENNIRVDEIRKCNEDYRANNEDINNDDTNNDDTNIKNNTKNNTKNNYEISLLLYKFNNFEKYDFDVDNIYIPLKYFILANSDNKLKEKINNLKQNVYCYLPTIMRKEYIYLFHSINFKDFNIKGFVVSNYGEINLFPKLDDGYDLIGNYTFNVFNSFSANELYKLGFSKLTISPELDLNDVNRILNDFSNLYNENGEILVNRSNNGANNNNQEMIVYGKIPLMNMNYCPLGKSNKCYKDCKRFCMNNKIYKLRDRMNLDFEILSDNTETVTTIFNSKINSIISPLNVDRRIDILDENYDEVKDIIKCVINNKRLEGKDYTEGNLNRFV